jgi:hypothetical protein
VGSSATAVASMSCRLDHSMAKASATPLCLNCVAAISWPRASVP